MLGATVPERPASKDCKILSLPQGFFPDFLRRAQNPDGGWGYHPGAPGSVEPTAWSILALNSQQSASGESLAAGSNWLRNAQTADGAWPTADGKHLGCWVTAIACLALLKTASPSDPTLQKGLQWLCETRPAEGKMMWRLQHTWSRQNIVRQNHSLSGWSWTPGTASWVEPTAFVLLLLKNVPEEFHPSAAPKRLELAERMLYDRVCPGGGWNAGNPLVYGVPGVPRVGPTVWALLALSDHRKQSANLESLKWLERCYEGIQGPGSATLANLCLRVYGVSTPPIDPRLADLYRNNEFLHNTLVMAWASLATVALPDWLAFSSRTRGDA